MDNDEFRILKNLLNFGPLTVDAVMTPESVVFSVQEDLTLQDAYNTYRDVLISRIPLYKENPDDVTGYVVRSELLSALLQGGGDRKLSEFKRKILIVDEKTELKKLLDEFVDGHEHISIVMNDYGVVLGLVTLEDLFETILGREIRDEFTIEEDLRAFARQKWKERAKRQGLIEPVSE